MDEIFSAADILLPDFISDATQAQKWAVIACDQFTSEPEYWKNAESIVGDAPSTLQMILPEAYLSSESETRLPKIADSMHAYAKDLLRAYKNSMIYVRRTIGSGKVRCGIVGKIDLEAYDYSVGSTSAVRATEGTVLERIPPRVAVRRAASLELPHIMLLIDDKEQRVIESLAAQTDSMERLYAFDLMQDGGHIEGYLLSEAQQKELGDTLTALFAKNGGSIRYAVGDGNHSLASAKARYEELKAEIGARAKEHPLRYALCEVVNLHDEALVFEPIYRLVRTKNKTDLLAALTAYGKQCADGVQTVECLYDGKREKISLGVGTHTLTVGTLQKFLDAYKAEHPETEIDYIHGIDSIEKLAAEADAIGFVFDGMRKEELFVAVEQDGALPRKTFSMGEAREKRYYIECRNITE